MDQQLALVTLGVRDLGVARSFYVEGLGWTPVLDLDEVVFLQVAPGVLLSLFAAHDLAADIGDGVSFTADRAPCTLAHNVGSAEAVDRATERVRAAGGTVVKEPQRAAFGGYHAYVADVDGFVWEIAHNPALTVGPDGTVQLRAIPD